MYTKKIFKGHSVVNLKQYTIYHTNRNQQNITSGGVATYIDSTHYSEPILLNSRLESFAIKILHPNLPNSQHIELPRTHSKINYRLHL